MNDSIWLLKFMEFVAKKVKVRGVAIDIQVTDLEQGHRGMLMTNKVGHRVSASIWIDCKLDWMIGVMTILHELSHRERVSL